MRFTALPGTPSNFGSPSRSPIESALENLPCPADLTRCAGIDACCVVSTRCRSTSRTVFRAPSGAKRCDTSSRAPFRRGRRFRTSCNADGHDQRERPMEARCGHSSASVPRFLFRFPMCLHHTFFFFQIPGLHPLDTTLCRTSGYTVLHCSEVFRLLYSAYFLRLLSHTNLSSHAEASSSKQSLLLKEEAARGPP